MPEEANKAVVLGYMDKIWNERRLDLFDKYIAEEVVLHSPLGDLDREAMKNTAAMLQKSMPDVTVSIEDVIAEGDRVVLRQVISATHQGEFLGIPASGNQVTVMAFYIFRVDGSKVVEIWGMSDNLGMMQQMGAIPMPAEAG